MDFKDMTANFMDDDQYFNLVAPLAVYGAIRLRKVRLNKEEKQWSLKFPITEDLEKLEAVIKSARRKLALLPTNTNKDRVSKTALTTYISKLEKHKEDILKSIEEEELRQKEEAENKVKEAEEKKKKEEEKLAKEESEKKEKEELEKKKLETDNKNTTISDDKKPKTFLYLGIGVGVLVLGLVLYMALKKKQPQI